jgi:iron complex outermembrane recepter protein
MNTRKLWTLMLAASGLALASSAHAAETAPAVPAADAPAPDAAAGGDNSGLTEIVVTATKRETNLQKTPISISVIGA